MSYSPEAIANSFIDAANRVGELMTPLKLQKLVYFAHGWHLGFELGPLSSKPPEASRWGPVFPDLYDAVKYWSRLGIQEPAQVMESTASGDRVTNPRVPADDEAALQLINRVWEVYGCMTALRLSHLSHAPGGPWDVTRRSNPGRENVEIPNDLIREFFAAKVRENEKAA